VCGSLFHMYTRGRMGRALRLRHTGGPTRRTLPKLPWQPASRNQIDMVLYLYEPPSLSRISRP